LPIPLREAALQRRLLLEFLTDGLADCQLFLHRICVHLSRGRPGFVSERPLPPESRMNEVLGTGVAISKRKDEIRRLQTTWLLSGHVG